MEYRSRPKANATLHAAIVMVWDGLNGACVRSAGRYDKDNTLITHYMHTTYTLHACMYSTITGMRCFRYNILHFNNRWFIFGGACV